MMATATQPSASRQNATTHSEIDRAISDLRQGANRLAKSSLDERIWIARECLHRVPHAVPEWIRRAADAKHVPPSGPSAAEEILCGPGPVMRYLHLIVSTLESIQQRGAPSLPGRTRVVDGQVRVATFPTRLLYDSLVFMPMTAETWLQPEVTLDTLHGETVDRLVRRTAVAPQVTLVLGAGNVAAIPATDALSIIFQNDAAALLKMNPVNEYLGPIFEQILEPLITAGFLRIVYGGSESGLYAVNHPQIDSVHITGSIATHDAIVWGSDPAQQQVRKKQGQPLVCKPITSELGNVTPWIIVPGDYSPAQLTSQAETIAASITNNASFNCIATKVIVTSKKWHQRDRFLNELESVLKKIPPRFAYYPGALERYAGFAGNGGRPSDQAVLPWTIRRSVNVDDDPYLFEQESFVCVTAETSLDETSPADFLHRAVDFANERLWGTLAASVTVPDSFRKEQAANLDSAIKKLNYGTIGINQWSGVAYGLVSPPWGAFPEPQQNQIQSGSGFVHNTYLLDRPQKTVLHSPLTLFPKPVWFSTNRRAEQIAWKLKDLYEAPSLWRLTQLLTQALRG